MPISQVDPLETDVAVLTGTDLKKLSPNELKHVLKTHTEIVFARTSPEQKYIIVSAFQELGAIVAATGDGDKITYRNLKLHFHLNVAE